MAFAAAGHQPLLGQSNDEQDNAKSQHQKITENTRKNKLLGAPGIATRSKDATRSDGLQLTSDGLDNEHSNASHQPVARSSDQWPDRTPQKKKH